MWYVFKRRVQQQYLKFVQKSIKCAGIAFHFQFTEKEGKLYLIDDIYLISEKWPSTGILMSPLIPITWLLLPYLTAFLHCFLFSTWSREENKKTLQKIYGQNEFRNDESPGFIWQEATKGSANRQLLSLHDFCREPWYGKYHSYSLHGW